MTAITPSGAAFLRIPTPAQLAGQVSRRARPVPEALGPHVHRGAVYWLETNIGIAFEHVGRLQHLRDHYGEQLRVVTDVHAEWAHKAGRGHQHPGPYAPQVAKDGHARMARVCKVCKRLEVNATGVLGDPWFLDASEVDEVRKLREELAMLPIPEDPPDPSDQWTHRGECATIRAARLHEEAELAAGRPRPVQVLGTNDGKAATLAFNQGLAERTTAGILREMVLAGIGSLNPERAWDVHLKMLEVAGISARRQPSGPEFFSTP